MRILVFFLVIFSLILAFSTIAESAPFLVCDPYPASGQQPIAFILIFDNGTPMEVGIQTNADGGVQLHYDLSSLAVGAHTVVAQSKTLWGVSASSVPLSFVKPATVPAAPTTLQLKAQ